jgi:hypothetical protein
MLVGSLIGDRLLLRDFGPYGIMCVYMFAVMGFGSLRDIIYDYVHLLLLILPNVPVEWLTFLLRIREVPGSNHSQETGYPEQSFSCFSTLSPGKFRDRP